MRSSSSCIRWPWKGCGASARSPRPNCTAAASARSVRSPQLGEPTLIALLGKGSGRHLSCAGAQPGPASGAGRAGGDGRSARNVRSAGSGGHLPSSMSCCSAWSIGSRRRMRDADRRGRTVMLRFRFDDFTRATRSHTLPRPTAQTPELLAAIARPDGCGRSDHRRTRPDPVGHLDRRISTARTMRCNWSCRSANSPPPPWIRRWTTYVIGSVRKRSPAASSRSRHRLDHADAAGLIAARRIKCRGACGVVVHAGCRDVIPNYRWPISAGGSVIGYYVATATHTSPLPSVVGASCSRPPPLGTGPYPPGWPRSRMNRINSPVDWTAWRRAAAHPQ